MNLLVITPDYASHAIPLMTMAGAWRDRGHRVVVATGPAMAPLVRRAGMEHTELIMSRGSNAGVLRTREAQDAEAAALERFFQATRGGMLEALRFQAEARSTDLLWRPRQVARRTLRIVDVHAPDVILADHLAFASTMALRSQEIPYGDVVLGHPTALPVGDEVYGVPSAWPPELCPDLTELAALRATALGVTEAFTFAYNDALTAIAPGSAGVDDAFAAHGDRVLYMYPGEMHGAERTALLPRHAFLGSAVRDEQPDADVAAWLAKDADRPLVVVSFGTFLSARSDVLRRTAEGLRSLDVRVALAIGASDPKDFADMPGDWLIRSTIPQVALLPQASALVTHGGNNSITEALSFGVPMVVLPFSTDQFDGAAAVERHLAGVGLDPNRVTRALIAGSVRGLLERPPEAPARISAGLQELPGPERAYRAMTDPLATVKPPRSSRRPSSQRRGSRRSVQSGSR
jgi:UDP:flavonoid glycosyltransferase YjiC (YdhE family)